MVKRVAGSSDSAWGPLLRWAGVALLAVMPHTAWGVRVPDWWKSPRQGDHINDYLRGEGSSRESRNAAYRAALDQVFDQIVGKIMLKAALGGDDARSDFVRSEIREWDIVRRDEGSELGKHYCWLLVKYPESEKQRVIGRLAGGESTFKRALALKSDNKLAESAELLVGLMSEYPLRDQELFDTEAAMMALAEVYYASKRFDKAMEVSKRLSDLRPKSTHHAEAMSLYRKANDLYDPLKEGMAAFAGMAAAVRFRANADGGAVDVAAGAPLRKKLAGYGLSFEGAAQAAGVVGIDCVMTVGAKTERKTWGIVVQVYPVSCAVTVSLPGGKGWEQTYNVRAADRMGRRDVILQAAADRVSAHVLKELASRGKEVKAKGE